MSLYSDRSYHGSESLVFVFLGQKLLIRNDKGVISVPSGKDLYQIQSDLSQPVFIGKLDRRLCFCTKLKTPVLQPPGFELFGLRDLFGNLTEKIFKMASLGLQVNNWDQTSKYCGKCGSQISLIESDWSKKCLSCANIDYPRISPAVIMAVTRGGKILLARPNRIKSGFYSVLAGYVNLGETLEECVKREVYEEVGLSVKDIRYFGSQSWPFTNSLMIAFTAEYASGEIRIEKNEIKEAAWFAPENLPQLPGWGSISRRLVDNFVEKTMS
jgi:NAD+ diphosphatase